MKMEIRFWRLEFILNFLMQLETEVSQDHKTRLKTSMEIVLKFLLYKNSNTTSKHQPLHPMSTEEERKINTAKTSSGATFIQQKLGQRSQNIDALGTLRNLTTISLSSLGLKLLFLLLSTKKLKTTSSLFSTTRMTSLVRNGITKTRVEIDLELNSRDSKKLSTNSIVISRPQATRSIIVKMLLMISTLFFLSQS